MITLNIVVFMIYGGLYNLWMIRSRKRQRKLQDTINQRDKIIQGFRQKDWEQIRDFRIAECLLQKTDRKQLTQFSKIIYQKEHFEWEVLQNPLALLFRLEFIELDAHKEKLTEMEYRICCLSLDTTLSNKEIAILLERNVNIVQMAKTRIRKKLQLGARGNIAEFFAQKQEKQV
jgi:DNA-binding CsgD family transcriptional regulator